jgi:hypothetical protein
MSRTSFSSCKLAAILVVFTPDPTGSHTEFKSAQLSHRIAPGLAVKQFTSISCLYFRKELKLLYNMYKPEQRYSANDHRKDFMINLNECDMHSPEIEPGSVNHCMPPYQII